MKRAKLNAYETAFIWSPVELWIRFYRASGNKQVCHLTSLLTNESYYAATDFDDWRCGWKMMEADNSELLPIHRPPTSQMSHSLPAILLSKPLLPLTPLVENLINA